MGHMNAIQDVRGWTEEFSVNVRLFDAQHRQLVRLICRLETSMSEGNARNQLTQMFSDLADYTSEHFAAEETAMNAYGFPWQDTHALAHRQFLARLDQLRNQWESGEVALSVHVLDELLHWLSGHVLGTDRMYTEHLNARGLF